MDDKELKGFVDNVQVIGRFFQILTEKAKKDPKLAQVFAETWEKAQHPLDNDGCLM